MCCTFPTSRLLLKLSGSRLGAPVDLFCAPTGICCDLASHEVRPAASKGVVKCYHTILFLVTGSLGAQIGRNKK